MAQEQKQQQAPPAAGTIQEPEQQQQQQQEDLDEQQEKQLVQELEEVDKKLQALKQTIVNADELLSMMVEENDATAERITKLHTLRKARPVKVAPF